MALEIRRAVSGDAAAIASFHVAAWESTYRGLIPDAAIDALTVERRLPQWERLLASDDHVAFLACRQDGIAGYALVGWRDDPAFANEAKLWGLYVDADCKGEGTGRRLMSVASAELLGRGYRKMSVHVLVTNPARTFYERLGGRYVQDREVEIDGERYVDAEYEFDL
jgi:GNAT superfamily N-acetyltransferase